MENLENKKKMIVGAVVICIVIGSLFILNATKKEKLDILSCCEVSYKGADGLGRPTRDCDLPWKDDTEEDWLKYNAFLAGINYTFDKKEKLSNGDEIQLSLDYDEELADELGVSIDKGPKSFKVEGLSKEYIEWKQVPKKLQSDLLAFMDNLVKEESDDFYENISNASIFGSMYEVKSIKRLSNSYTFDIDKVQGVMNALYRIDYTETDNFLGESQEKVSYESITLSGVNPEKTMEDYKQLWTVNNTVLSPVGTEEDNEEAVIREYEN